MGQSNLPVRVMHPRGRVVLFGLVLTTDPGDGWRSRTARQGAHAHVRIRTPGVWGDWEADRVAFAPELGAKSQARTARPNRTPTIEQ